MKTYLMINDKLVIERIDLREDEAMDNPRVLCPAQNLTQNIENLFQYIIDQTLIILTEKEVLTKKEWN